MKWQFSEIEDKILSLILRDREFAILVLDDLDRKYFSNESYSHIFNVVGRFYRKFKGIPDIADLKAIITGLPSVRDRVDILELERVYNQQITPASKEYITTQVPAFIKYNKMHSEIIRVASKMQNVEDLEEAGPVFDVFQENIKNIMMYNMDKDLGLNLTTEIGKRYMALKSKYEKGIRPALDGLSDIIRGGYFRGETYAYIGTTGSGKSILLANDALRAMLDGFNVVYISLELSEDIFALRMDQKFTNRTAKELLSGNDTIKYLEKRYAEAVKVKEAGTMWVKEFPTGSASIQTIERYLEMLKMYKDFECDFLVLDYGDILAPIGGYTGNRYHDQGTVFQEIARLAKTLDIPVLTAMQANRPNKDNRGQVIDESRLADSYDKLRILTGAYSINSTESGEMLNKYFLFSVKNRNGAAGVRVPFIMDKARMTVFDDTDPEEESEV